MQNPKATRRLISTHDHKIGTSSVAGKLIGDHQMVGELE